MRHMGVGGEVLDFASDHPESHESCGEDAASSFSTATSNLASGGGAKPHFFKETACNMEDFHISPKESSAQDLKAAGVTADFLDTFPQESSALGLERAIVALPCPFKDDVSQGTNPHKN